MHNHDDVLAFWNRPDVESMYDKHLLGLEISLIRARIPSGAKILDAGCGEGEGTAAYAGVPGVVIDAVDFSETRLAKAAERVGRLPNVRLRRVDFLGDHSLAADYDLVISQRFLINVTDWQLQQSVLLHLMARLRPGGRLLMLEGSQQGVDSLNAFRDVWGLPPIPVKWHNLFFDDSRLQTFMADHDYRLVDHDGLGAYFLLTRGIRPVLDSSLAWDSRFNEIAATAAVADTLALGARASRLKLWCFEK